MRTGGVERRTEGGVEQQRRSGRGMRSRQEKKTGRAKDKRRRG